MRCTRPSRPRRSGTGTPPLLACPEPFAAIVEPVDRVLGRRVDVPPVGTGRRRRRGDGGRAGPGGRLVEDDGDPVVVELVRGGVVEPGHVGEAAAVERRRRVARQVGRYDVEVVAPLGYGIAGQREVQDVAVHAAGPGGQRGPIVDEARVRLDPGQRDRARPIGARQVIQDRRELHGHRRRADHGLVIDVARGPLGGHVEARCRVVDADHDLGRGGVRLEKAVVVEGEEGVAAVRQERVGLRSDRPEAPQPGGEGAGWVQRGVRRGDLDAFVRDARQQLRGGVRSLVCMLGSTGVVACGLPAARDLQAARAPVDVLGSATDAAEVDDEVVVVEAEEPFFHCS